MDVPQIPHKSAMSSKFWVVQKSWLTLQKRAIPLWLLIIFSINVFGIFHGMNIPHLSVPGIGTLHLKDLILLVMTMHVACRFCYKLKSSIVKPPLFNPLLALFAVAVLNSIIDLSEGINPHYLFRGWRHIAYYLVFFILINEIENKKNLYHFMTGLIVIATITSIVAYLQFIFGWSFSASKVEFMGEHGIYRTYQQGNVLIGLCILMIFSIILSGHIRSKQVRVAACFVVIFLLGAFLTSFARSSCGSMLVALLFVLFLSRKRRIGASFIMIPVLLVAFYIANVGIRTMADTSLFEILKTRSMSSVEDILGAEGTFYIRILMLQTKWQTVMDENPVLGIGFDSAVPISDSTPTNYEINMHPSALVADSSWPNILLLFGFTGVLIFFWILISFFRFSISVWRRLSPSLDKAIILGIIAFNIQIVLVSFFGDRFTNPFSVAILMTSWAIVVLIRRFVFQNRG
ncbi:MAG: O-antigen ligase family protein [Thermoplasmatales archaeon]|nr:O-antigen ligase family protein [Thermoplasmatales archaeon]